MIFLPRINRVISSFVAGWNKHPLCTERNQSPERLWANGMMNFRNRHQVQVAEFEENINNSLDWYGFDPNAPTPVDDGLSQVELDDIASPFSVEELNLLRNIDVLRESNNYGIDIFLEARQLMDV